MGWIRWLLRWLPRRYPEFCLEAVLSVACHVSVMLQSSRSWFKSMSEQESVFAFLCFYFLMPIIKGKLTKIDSADPSSLRNLYSPMVERERNALTRGENLKLILRIKWRVVLECHLSSSKSWFKSMSEQSDFWLFTSSRRRMNGK